MKVVVLMPFVLEGRPVAVGDEVEVRPEMADLLLQRGRVAVARPVLAETSELPAGERAILPAIRKP